MCEKSPTLSDLIAAEIAANGPIPFARFMELALYHPQFGYYASGMARIGRTGDFYTNVSIGPVFGRILAGQFREMAKRLGEPAKFCLVEQGANNGQLAVDVLSALLPELPLEYWIVEPSAALRSQQQEKLRPFSQCVHWAEDLPSLPEFEGVHFSNELVDALPFHLVRSTGTTWEELLVDGLAGNFRFHNAPPSADIATEIPNLPNRAAGTIAELRPVANEWLKHLAGKMRCGFVLVIDYGFPREQLLAPHRSEGTFSCYQSHRRDFRPLADPGKKDITAHVDFSALKDAAQASGFHFEGFTDQNHFLIGSSEDLLTSLDGPPDAATQKTLRALQTLLHPESMGTQFQYFLLSKDTKSVSENPLPGFRYSRNSRLD
jgi:SAM-dependent MidA family methyltransferase